MQDPKKQAKHAYKRGKYDAKKLGWFRFARKFLLLVLVLFLLFRFVIGVSVVSGSSMYDTLVNGDVVVYSRIVGSVSRGDIVSVSIPSGEYYVKRVLAVGGDTVDIRDGKLYVNGVEETGDYVEGRTLPEDGAFTYPLTLGEDDIFTIGDNREGSVDSRYYGAINVSQVTGKLLFRFGWLYANFL